MKHLSALTFACSSSVAGPAHAQFGSLSDRIKQAQEAKANSTERSPRSEDLRRGRTKAWRRRQRETAPGLRRLSGQGRHEVCVARRQGPGAGQLAPVPGLAVHRARYRRRQRVRVSRRIVHVTRGLLGLLKNEAELAGVLGHEITHVTAKHTVRAIQKNKVVIADRRGSRRIRPGLSDSVISEACRSGVQEHHQQRVRSRRRSRSRPRRHRPGEQGWLCAARRCRTC